MVQPVEPPFIAGRRVQPPHFIDRESELARMATGLGTLAENQVLMAQRRMGKSSLLYNVALRIRAQHPDVLVCSVDCRRITSAFAFTDAVVGAVLDAYAQKHPVKGWLTLKARLLRDRISDLVRDIERVGVRAVRDAFHLYVERREKRVDDDAVLEAAFRFLAGFCRDQEHPVVLVLDEFQELADLPGDRVFQLFKSYSDELDRVRFAFSGSGLGLLDEVFQRPDSPMYLMASKVRLDPLPAGEVQSFVQQRLASAGMTVGAEAAALVHDLTGGIPFYVQKLGLQCWLGALADGRDRIDASHVHAAFDDMVSEFGSEFEARFQHRFGPLQKELLVALAAGSRRRSELARAVERPEGQLSHALTSLVDGMEVQKLERGRYALCDPVFGVWLHTRLSGAA